MMASCFFSSINVEFIKIYTKKMLTLLDLKCCLKLLNQLSCKKRKVFDFGSIY